MGICEKHWPSEAPMRQVKRFHRPVDPPSVFTGCPSSCIPFVARSRHVDERGVSSEKRSDIDQLAAFESQDKIIS